MNQYQAFWEADTRDKLHELIAGSRPWEDSVRHAHKEWEEWILTGAIDDITPVAPVVLEWGCGVGRLLRCAPYPGATLIGVDMSESMLAEAARMAQGAALVRTDGTSVCIASDSVDLVYSFLVLQHVPSRAAIRAIVSEWQRVLRPGRFVRAQTLCAEPHPEGSFGGFHGATFRTPNEFEQVFVKAGLEVVETHVGGLADKDYRQTKPGSLDRVDNWIWVTARKPI